MEWLQAEDVDAVLANESQAGWVAWQVRAGSKRGFPIVLDAHEYEPLEVEYSHLWMLTVAPLKSYFFNRYARDMDTFITVCQPIAERYRSEYGLRPVVILNAPEFQPGLLRQPHSVDPNRLRLIHHGQSGSARRLETMIFALAQCEPRYSLHFMLTDNDSPYSRKLRKLGDRLAPRRVFFRDPVPVEDVTTTISAYDIGFCFVAPTNYSYAMSMPNKFFESMAAGLAVCIGPSPAMAQVVREYDMGCIAGSFEAADLATTLNALTVDRVIAMRRAALEAARNLNADVEMAKLVDLFANLLGTARGTTN
jgi:glycosyltransferase involved in cell wall biosynthesis